MIPSKRSVGLSVLLTIITCGIYGLYLIYKVSDDVNQIAYRKMNRPGVDLLLVIVTCGIYGFYWYYKIGRQIADVEYEIGMRVNDTSILCLILAIIALPIVAMAILQSEINTILDEISAA